MFCAGPDYRDLRLSAPGQSHAERALSVSGSCRVPALSHAAAYHESTFCGHSRGPFVFAWLGAGSGAAHRCDCYGRAGDEGRGRAERGGEEGCDRRPCRGAAEQDQREQGHDAAQHARVGRLQDGDGRAEEVRPANPDGGQAGGRGPWIPYAMVATEYRPSAQEIFRVR